MNLNALINPTSRGGYTWSRLYQVMPQQPGQYDGFNYLGLGVLALITAALLFSLRQAVRCPQNTKTWWHRNGLRVFNAVCRQQQNLLGQHRH